MITLYDFFATSAAGVEPGVAWVVECTGHGASNARVPPARAATCPTPASMKPPTSPECCSFGAWTAEWHEALQLAVPGAVVGVGGEVEVALLRTDGPHGGRLELGTAVVWLQDLDRQGADGLM